MDCCENQRFSRNDSQLVDHTPSHCDECNQQNITPVKGLHSRKRTIAPTRGYRLIINEIYFIILIFIIVFLLCQCYFIENALSIGELL